MVDGSVSCALSNCDGASDKLQQVKNATAAHPARPSLLAALLAMVMLSGSPQPAAGAVSDVAVAYIGGSVLNATGDGFMRDATLLVRGSRIVAVGPASAIAVPPGTRLVQLDGRYVIPGFINSHVHLATRAEPREARAYLRRELFSGVTMVRDMAGDVRLIAELKREAAEDEIPSPDIYYAALMAGESFFDDPRTHDASHGLEPGKAPWMRAVTATTDLPLAIAEAKGTGATGIKLYADLPASLVRALTEEAHRQGLLVWAHAAVFPARPSEVIAAGTDVVSHADFLAFESVTPFPETFAEAKSKDLRDWQMTPAVEGLLAEMMRRGTILDATVDVGYRSPVPQWPSALAPQLAHEAYVRGIPISAGADDDADWSDLDSALLSEIERLVRNVGMTAADALRSATVVGARTIGQQDAAGVLSEGRIANFVVLRANPLRDIHNLRSIALVVKHGIPYRRSSYRPVTVREMRR